MKVIINNPLKQSRRITKTHELVKSDLYFSNANVLWNGAKRYIH